MALYLQGSGPQPARPIGCIYSEFWKYTRQPVKRLVIDECDKIKKPEGSFFIALDAIDRRATILLSGTILSNKWYDISNAIAMLSGHPFNTRRKFLNAIAIATRTTRKQECEEPDIVSFIRLMMAFVIARPSACLAMPGLEMIDITFELTKEESEKVTEATLRYERARRTIEKRGGNNTDHKRALGFAVIAQLRGAHGYLANETPDDVPTAAVELDGDIDNLFVYLSQMDVGDNISQSRNDWIKRLDNSDHSALKGSSRVQALVVLIRHVRMKYPGEKIVIFSTFLKFLDIVARVIRSEFGDTVLEYNGTIDASTKTKVQHDSPTLKVPPFSSLQVGLVELD
jgi:SNF2 family DNA or RNA helicase